MIEMRGRHRWRTGGSVASNGYVKIRVGKEHPLADPNGYCYEHLLVWVSAGNPRPGKGQVIHHENEDKTDSRIGNLKLQTRGQHNAHHNAIRGRDVNGRFLPKKTGSMLDGVEHKEYPEILAND